MIHKYMDSNRTQVLALKEVSNKVLKYIYIYTQPKKSSNAQPPHNITNKIVGIIQNPGKRKRAILISGIPTITKLQCIFLKEFIISLRFNSIIL